MKKLSILTSFMLLFGLVYTKAQTIDISNGTCHTMTVCVYYDDPKGACGTPTKCADVWSTCVTMTAGQAHLMISPPCPDMQIYAIEAWEGGIASTWYRSGCGNNNSSTFSNGPCFGMNNFEIQSCCSNTVFEINPF